MAKSGGPRRWGEGGEVRRVIGLERLMGVEGR